MTNDEINRAIAKQRGEYKEGKVAKKSGRVWWEHEVFPRYTDDWAAAGPLLEMAAGVGYHPQVGSWDGQFWCKILAGTSLEEIVPAHLGIPSEAIARAYHAAFCN